MAITVIGGIVVATFLTLVVIPVLYAVLDRKSFARPQPRTAALATGARLVKHTDIALRRPVTTLMTFAAIAVIGVVAARLLPLEQFPDVTFPFMGVTIPYPGSTPEEVEELITRPVEDALSTLPGIEQIRSTSGENEATFEIGFDWDTDIDAASFEVRTKLDSIRAQLPRGAERVLMSTASSADAPIIAVRLSAFRDLSSQYEVLDRFLKKPIERIDGVARVQLAGVEPREVRVLVDAGRIAAHGIDLQKLVDLLERSNFSVSAGQITARGERLSVRPSASSARSTTCATSSSTGTCASATWPKWSSSARSSRFADISTAARPSASTSSSRRRRTSSRSSIASSKP